MDEWNKQAFKKMELSEQQKRALIQGASKPPMKKSYVPIVMPLFVIGLLFLLFISGNGEHVPTTVSPADEAIDHQAYFQELFIYVGLITIFYGIALFMAIKLIQKPGRFIAAHSIRKLHGMVEKNKAWRILLILVLVYIALFLFILTFDTSVLFLKYVLGIILLLNNFLIQAVASRFNKRASCPSCGVELLTKEVLLSQKCSVCKSMRIRNVKHGAKNYLIYFHGVFIMPLFTIMQLPLLMVILYLICYITYTFIVILPYMEDYLPPNENIPPLW